VHRTYIALDAANDRIVAEHKEEVKEAVFESCPNLKSNLELERRARRPIDLCIRTISGWVRSIGRFARRSTSVWPIPN